MHTRSLLFEQPEGLKSKLATEFAQKAAEFRSGIWIEKENRRVNAKSLLGVLSLAVSTGDTITILADGDDQENAVNILCEMLEKKKED